jgi:hypothetical protein
MRTRTRQVCALFYLRSGQIFYFSGSQAYDEQIISTRKIMLKLLPHSWTISQNLSFSKMDIFLEDSNFLFKIHWRPLGNILI